MGWNADAAEAASEEFYGRSNTGKNWRPKKKGRYLFYLVPIPGHPNEPFLPLGKHELKTKEYRSVICNRMTHSWIDPKTGQKRPVPCVACVYRNDLEKRNDPLASQTAGQLEPKMKNLVWLVVRGDKELEKGVQTWAMSPAQFDKLKKLAKEKQVEFADLNKSFGVMFDFDPDETPQKMYGDFKLVTLRVKKDAKGQPIKDAAGQPVIVKIAPGLAAFAEQTTDWVSDVMANAPSPTKVLPLKSPSDVADVFKIPLGKYQKVRDDYDKVVAIMMDSTGTAPAAEPETGDDAVAGLDDGVVEEREDSAAGAAEDFQELAGGEVEPEVAGEPEIEGGVEYEAAAEVEGGVEVEQPDEVLAGEPEAAGEVELPAEEYQVAYDEEGNLVVDEGAEPPAEEPLAEPEPEPEPAKPPGVQKAKLQGLLAEEKARAAKQAAAAAAKPAATAKPAAPAAKPAGTPAARPAGAVAPKPAAPATARPAGAAPAARPAGAAPAARPAGAVPAGARPVVKK